MSNGYVSTTRKPRLPRSSASSRSTTSPRRWPAAPPSAPLPLPAVSQLNSRLLKYFVKRYTLKRGAIAFGKLLPVGIGAVVGGVGNRLMGRKIIANARQAFGNPPQRWPSTLHVLPAPQQ